MFLYNISVDALVPNPGTEQKQKAHKLLQKMMNLLFVTVFLLTFNSSSAKISLRGLSSAKGKKGSGKKVGGKKGGKAEQSAPAPAPGLVKEQEPDKAPNELVSWNGYVLYIVVCILGWSRGLSYRMASRY